MSTARRLTSYYSPQIEVEVRLNTNEMPWPVPESVIEDARRYLASHELNRYPDRMQRELRQALAELHGVEPESVWCGVGSNEVLMAIMLAFGGPAKRARIYEPTYRLHSHIARLTFTEVLSLERGPDYLLPAGEEGSLEGEIVFLCSPNNPTGLVEPPERVRGVLSRASGVVVIDEAYAPFCEQDYSKLACRSENVISVRTFSKAFGIAGARVGYAISSPGIVESLQVHTLPYNLPLPSQALALAALKHRELFEQRAKQVAVMREKLYHELSKFVRAIPSQANFITFFAEPLSAEKVWEDLLARSILVRRLDGFPLLENALRVTVGTEEENERFLDAVAAIYSVEA